MKGINWLLFIFITYCTALDKVKFRGSHHGRHYHLGHNRHYIGANPCQAGYVPGANGVGCDKCLAGTQQVDNQCVPCDSGLASPEGATGCGPSCDTGFTKQGSQCLPTADNSKVEALTDALNSKIDSNLALSNLPESQLSKDVNAPDFSGFSATDDRSERLESQFDDGEARPFRSIDYLGMGYDIAIGFPAGDDGSAIDPGFKVPIIKLDHRKSVESPIKASEGSEGGHHEASLASSEESESHHEEMEGGLVKKTLDERTLVPLQGYAYRENSCVLSQEEKKVSSWSEYQDELRYDATVTAGVTAVVATGSFLFSRGKDEFQKEVTDQKKEMYITTSYCLIYVAGLSILESSKLEGNDYFKSVAGHLGKIEDSITAGSPEETDYVKQHFSKWKPFFVEFGTHFVSKVHLGGKMIHTVTVASTDLNSNSGTSTDTGGKGELGGNFNGVGASAGGGLSVGTGKDAGLSNGKANLSKKTSIIGGTPPEYDELSNIGFASWARSVAENPVPVKYQLVPLYFVSDELIDERTYNLMLQTYLGDLGVDAQSEAVSNLEKTSIDTFPEIADSEMNLIPQGAATTDTQGSPNGSDDDDPCDRTKHPDTICVTPTYFKPSTLATASGTDPGTSFEFRFTPTGDLQVVQITELVQSSSAKATAQSAEIILFSTKTAIKDSLPTSWELRYFPTGDLCLYHFETDKDGSGGKWMAMWCSGTDAKENTSHCIKRIAGKCKTHNHQCEKGIPYKIVLRNDGELVMLGNTLRDPLPGRAPDEVQQWVWRSGSSESHIDSDPNSSPKSSSGKTPALVPPMQPRTPKPVSDKHGNGPYGWRNCNYNFDYYSADNEV